MGQNNNKTMSESFGMTGFNFKGKKDEFNQSKTNYTGAPWANTDQMQTTTGDLATTNPETYLNERSSSTWGDRDRKRNIKKIKQHIKGPDFKKILSRDYVEKIHEDKRTVIPFSRPNHNYTTSSIFLLN
jgi:hypothetical protein